MLRCDGEGCTAVAITAQVQARDARAEVADTDGWTMRFIERMHGPNRQGGSIDLCAACSKVPATVAPAPCTPRPAVAREAGSVELPSASGKRCAKCGEPGHYATNRRFHPLGDNAARSLLVDSSPATRTLKCLTCGIDGHNSRTCPDRASKASEYDDADAAPPTPPTRRHLKPLPHALEAAERRAIAREANPVNPRGTLPAPRSSWVL